ncbi:hypothetical protein Lal_00023023 [Lupinus albus]|nr:hypothetical protein Lal_00023023 [Lupinus albus]
MSLVRTGNETPFGTGDPHPTALSTCLIIASLTIINSSGGKSESKSLFETQDHVGGDGKSGGHMLRHFFDDWPRSLQQSSENGGRVNSATCLTISMPENKTLLHRMCP